MAEPRPLLALVLAEGLGLLALAGWWATLPAAERVLRLTRVMLHEGVGLALVIGVSEGLARRRQDVMGGFLLRWWTLGCVGLALVPGVLAGVLVAPWPLELSWIAGGSAALGGLIGYGLMAGRPYLS